MPLNLAISETEAPRFRVCHERVDLRTRERLQFIDLTVLVAERVRRSGIADGTVNIQSRHTTTAILVNENEPLLLADLCRLLEQLAPVAGPWLHDDLKARESPRAPDERANGHAHARAVLLGASETLNVAEGKLELGRWQRIFLVELDGPQKRSVSISVMGLARGESAFAQSDLVGETLAALR